ncbi:NAD(P)-dependent oxidoreductase [Candidimonas sp. SYP-B2681]|uniref:NAD(P)-dependent oxidoreductase n=1 Tax=Candidimonas sp. SYP-B2681 TaxID=2497686 RepID=UPI000F86E650|nr:NAD(P)-dependent oxidoreductase [Candidimonas sp. SYP-B2681]RTZ47463.1 NAD(P)-dependent oxidoreductase [Candidimonas sp. SYP-B2681]
MIRKVGFIGLGTMGQWMAANLIKAGFQLIVHDVASEAVAKTVEAGAAAADSPAEVGRQSDVVILMLPNTPDVQSVLFSNDGLIHTPPAKRLIVDMSTISPVAVRQFSADLAAKKIAFLDAPVSGGPTGARDASLTIMVGGDSDAFEMARPVLNALGTSVTHVGNAGAGQTLKLCNQLICGVNIQAICEALALARASGIDLSLLRQVLLGGSAVSWMLDKLGPAMIDRDPAAGFRIDLMLKDLKLVQELAFELSVPLPATALVTTQYLDARAHGEGSNGNQALFTVYDRSSNQAGPPKRASE